MRKNKFGIIHLLPLLVIGVLVIGFFVPTPRYSGKVLCKPGGNCKSQEWYFKSVLEDIKSYLDAQSGGAPIVKTEREIGISGTVTNNITTCTVDELCTIDLPVEEYLMIDDNDTEYKVVYHYGEFPPCINQTATLQGEQVQVGDQVEIFGELMENNKISTCDSEKYYIKKL